MRFSLGKRVAQWLEYVGIKLLFCLLRPLGIRRASALMGWLIRKLAPLASSKNRIARRNLQAAFPQWDDARITATLNDMWDNMGRYLGEFPFIAPMSAEAFRDIAEIRGEEYLHAATSSGKGSLFFSAHMANWELGAKCSWACGVPFSIVYRPLNNPWVDAETTAHRNQYQRQGLPKNPQGSRELIKTLRRGEPVAILIDQKMNTGIPVPFFGREAMTSPAIAELAIKYDLPIIPTQVERLGPEPRFRITFHPPVQWQKSGDTAADAIAIMRQLHQMMEEWIQQHPAQWFWVHKRWG